MAKINSSPFSFPGRLAAALALAAAALPGQALAHGSMESPASRVYACFLENPENPSSAVCIAAAALGKQPLYDWNGVRIGEANGQHRARIPDGQLCSAGDPTFSALDAARDDWPSSTITPNADGKLDMSFLATAPHATAYIRLYITEQGYDATAPLDWATLESEPFCELTEGEFVRGNGRFQMSCPFPSGQSGRRPGGVRRRDLSRQVVDPRRYTEHVGSLASRRLRSA